MSRKSTNSIPEFSTVLPVFNEDESLHALEAKLFPVLEKIGRSFEVVIINDGSTDRSAEILAEIAERQPCLTVVNFRRNHGQTAAMMAGIDYSRAPIIVTIDSDLQNDPQDIPMLLEKLNEGYDVVSGWRKDRKDSAIKRNFVSRIANRIISAVSGVHLHDYGCTLKAYRREVVEGFRLYGEMHRFIPIYASWMGAKIVEVPVRHHARAFGSSKYGLERTGKVLLDLLVVWFFDRFFTKPVYLFGGAALFCLLMGLICGLWAVGLKLFASVSFILTPLPMLTVFFVLTGIVCLLIGLLAEVMVRTYFESQGRRSYHVSSVLGSERKPE